jgi:hypothetical protein
MYTLPIDSLYGGKDSILCAALTFAVNTTGKSCSGSCDGAATITAYGGLPPYTYLWSDGQVMQVATGLCDGVHMVTVIDAAQDTATDMVTINDLCTGNTERRDFGSVKIFPNPFYEQTIIRTNHPFKSAVLIMYDVLGREARRIINLNGNSFSLLRENLPAGIYFIHLQDKVRSVSFRIIVTDGN